MEIAGYRIDELIGRGGMGVVYRAEHVHLRRTVALKVLAPEVADTEGFRERFVHESRVAAGIDHPAIVTVYDAGEVDGQLYLAMRYVEGSDLATALSDEGRLPPDRALSILEQVGSALDAAHAHGLVHRDVKPGNVLLQGDRAYLTDFGLTKRIDAATAFTATGQFVGTIDYVAPEQIRGGDIGPPTDVYALGCVLHQCLTGARPFPRDSDVAVLYAHLEEPPPRPSAAGLPPALDPVLTRALAKDPADRHPSCSALIAEARKVMEEPATVAAAPVPTAAAPAPVPATASTRTLPPRSRRRPALIAGAAGVAVVAAVAVVLAGGGSGDDPPQRAEPPAGRPDADEPPAAEAVQTVEVGQEPVGVAVRDGSVWVTNSGDGTVTRLDARSGEVMGDAIPVGTAPAGITVGQGAVWVSNVGDGTVSRLNADTGDPEGQPIAVGAEPRWLALGVGDNSLWVSNGRAGTVSRVDIGSGRAIDEIEVGSDPRGIATTRQSVWVANSGDGTLTRIDVDSGEADEPVPAGTAPEGMAIKDGVIWVANAGDGTVSRLDNRTGEPRGEPVQVGGVPFAVWVGEEFAWVTDADGAVTLIDPSTAEVVGGPVQVGPGPAGVRVEEGAAWVAVRDGNRAVRLEPTR